ncbi:DHA2 family efflux MFS transporter permease subunit [Nocardia sp. NPDC088792]|uniref:DHA2 family efflux MFS transporter permease subunit n=1 Tax=Nocardia sp. NPDC088792 TaxID=3364332 RepID=UPI00382F2E65
MNTEQRWTLALTSVASLMVGLDALVVTTALNTIRLHLGASMADLEWTVNAYTLTFAMLMLTAAAIGDRIGRRTLLLAGLGLFTAASAGCALAPDIAVLIAARAVQGVGSAMVMPAALSLIGGVFGPEQRGRAMGVFAGVTGLAILGGPVLGGVVVQGMAWEWIFWLNVPIGAVLIPLAYRRIAESRGPARPLDPIGLVLSGLGVLGLVWGLVRGNGSGWGSAEVVGALAGGAVLLAVFVEWELRAPAPMLPMRLFVDRGFGAANLAGFAMTAGIFGAAFFFAQYLQAGLHESPLAAGVRMLPWTATLFVIAPLAGARMNRIGERRLVVAGLAGEAIGFAWIAAVSGSGYAVMVAPMMVAGIGISAAMPAVQNAVLNSVEPRSIGTASGVYSTMRQLGGAFGIAVASAVFLAHGGYSSAAAVATGFRAAMLVTAALAALGGVAGLAVTRRRAAVSRQSERVPSAMAE